MHGPSQQLLGMQDLVEALADPTAWQIPTKVDQASYHRKPDGSFVGFEVCSDPAAVDQPASWAEAVLPACNLVCYLS